MLVSCKNFVFVFKWYCFVKFVDKVCVVESHTVPSLITLVTVSGTVKYLCRYSKRGKFFLYLQVFVIGYFAFKCGFPW